MSTKGKGRWLRAAVALAIGLWCLAVGAERRQEYVFPERVKPIIETLWGQVHPYNLMAPARSFNGLPTRPPSGCGAVAMAQVICHHRYPDMSPDGQYAYDYGLMYRTANGHQTRDELISVAKLISDCGVTAFTQYNDDYSSTDMGKVMAGLKGWFHYTDMMGLYRRKDFDSPHRDSLWRQLIFEELSQGRPVVYRGYSPTEKGHLFIIDGCKGRLVHVNMGWAGLRNGYYSLDDLAGYDEDQWMLTGIADTTYRPRRLEVALSSPGQLATLLRGDEAERTRHIALRGPIDSTDIAQLRHMLRQGLLSTIDLRLARIPCIPDSAFALCDQLTDMALPPDTREIGRDAFASCHNLNRILLPDSLRHIRAGAFRGCQNLLTLSLPSSLQTIGAQAFIFCNALFHVVVPEGVWRLDQDAFSHMANLISLQLPGTLRRTSRNLVRECPRLRRLTIPDTNPHFRIEGTQIQKK